MADLDDIIKTIIAEANGEGPEGMRRVAETMINRSALRGLSLGDVVRQPHQYTGFQAPGPLALKAESDPRARQTALQALELAFGPDDPTGGADHYLNPNQANPNWANALTTTGDYGNHRFFSSQPIPQDALARVLSSGSELFGPRLAPTPASPQQQLAARGGNVLSGTFGAGANPGALSATTQQSIADMFAPKANSVTPHLNRNGSILDPAAIVFGGDMEKNIFAGGAGSLTPGPAVGGPPATRRVQSVAMPAGRDPIGAGSSFADLISKLGPTSTAVAQTKATTTPSVIRTASLAGQTALPGGVRPNVPSTVPAARPPAIDSVLGKTTFDDLVTAFAPRQNVSSANGTTLPNKGQERLPATLGPRNNAAAPGTAIYGGLDPNLVRTTPIPRPAAEAEVARAPKPIVRTQTVANPAYESMKRQIEAGTLSYNGLSRDSVAARAAGQAMVEKLKQQLANTPQTITVKKTVTPKVAAVPAARPAARPTPAPAPSNPLRITVQGNGPMTKLQQLQALGYTAAQASDLANQGNGSVHDWANDINGRNSSSSNKGWSSGADSMR